MLTFIYNTEISCELCIIKYAELIKAMYNLFFLSFDNEIKVIRLFICINIFIRYFGSQGCTLNIILNSNLPIVCYTLTALSIYVHKKTNGTKQNFFYNYLQSQTKLIYKFFRA